ncbi:MAG: DUF4097 family beta strand repeat protein [Chloroflexia bacterium]|nr:DUF4097 family beta strand repeat protein [Chloroflexia bacterium]
MTERLEVLAAGAAELRVDLKKGDITARGGEVWSLEWTSEGSDAPEIERDGTVLRIRQRNSGFLTGGFDLKRLDLRLTVPAGVEAVELRTGLGKVDAEGLHGRLTLTTGNGAVSLRNARGDGSLNTGNGAVSIEEFDGTLIASTGNGRVRVNRLTGTLTLNTGNGTVEVLDVDGRVRASTGNGEVKLTSVAGEVELNSGHGAMEILAPRSLGVQANTAMGTIRVDGGSLRSLRANSVMGEILCAARLEPGKYDITSGMGAINVQLPADTHARVDAQTSFGQVDSDFPLVRVGRSGPMGFGGVRMVGSIGEGEPRVELNLRSGKGPIRLRRMSEVVSEPRPAPHAWPRPEPPPPPHVAALSHQGGPAGPQDPTLAVLEAVARGELSPEQAERLLAATPNQA